MSNASEHRKYHWTPGSEKEPRCGGEWNKRNGLLHDLLGMAIRHRAIEAEFDACKECMKLQALEEAAKEEDDAQGQAE